MYNMKQPLWVKRVFVYKNLYSCIISISILETDQYRGLFLQFNWCTFFLYQISEVLSHPLFFHYSTLRCSTLLYSTLLYFILLCCSPFYCTLHSSVILLLCFTLHVLFYYFILYYFYSILFYYTMLYSTLCSTLL